MEEGYQTHPADLYNILPPSTITISIIFIILSLIHSDANMEMYIYKVPYRKASDESVSVKCQ